MLCNEIRLCKHSELHYNILYVICYIFKNRKYFIKTYLLGKLNKLNKNIFFITFFFKYLKTHYYFLYNKQYFSLTSKKNSKCAPRPVVENC